MAGESKTSRRGPRIFISAGELSGDRIGAAFIRAFRSICPEATFIGFGGEAMRREGLEVVRDLTVHAAMWFLKSFLMIPRMYGVLRESRRVLDEERPDASVVIDYPGLHFFLTREAKRRGIPSIYYVTPQVWAYNPYRTVKMKKTVDRALVVFPFEEPFLAGRGISTGYVGHPLMDELRAEWGDADPPPMKAGAPILGILPGSRRQEVSAALPHMIRAAHRIREEEPRLRILASYSQPGLRSMIEDTLAGTGIPTEVLEAQSGRVLREARLSLVTSGTITLEGAFHRSPMVVLYRIPAISYWASRPWRLVPYITLPNILAEEEIVPEFVLWSDRDAEFVEAARRCFADQEERQRIRGALQKVRGLLLDRPNASLTAAQEVLQLIQGKNDCVDPST